MEDEAINKALSESTGVSGDFCCDLDAMHEAEMLLDDPSWTVPGTIIKGSLCLFDAYTSELASRFGSGLRATSRQRSEAFLRTLGLWKE